MSSNNRLIIAAAGAGKTTFLVNEALNLISKNVLITTYTQNNEAEIRRRIIEKKGFIPRSITIQTWFSFIIQHGVKPYQSCIIDNPKFIIKGMKLVNEQSAKYKKADTKEHYISSSDEIYSDKISKFFYDCNKKSEGKVVHRLSEIYTHIFIDETQDLAGHDLELISLFVDSSIEMLFVCDPRQATYSTNNSQKNKKHRRENIINYFKELKEKNKITIDDTTLSINYRCNEQICKFSDKLFPKYSSVKSGNKETTEHYGIFLVKKKDLDQYIERYNPMQLRYNKRTKVKDNFFVENFGDSKGLSFDRVIIYPTKDILKWLKDEKQELNLMTKSKLYVAITRARFSVTFVVGNDQYDIKGFNFWNRSY